MKKEFGKWLLDVSKYITTAVVLSNIFGEVEDKMYIFIGGGVAIAMTLIWGLYLVKEPTITKNKKNNNKKR